MLRLGLVILFALPVVSFAQDKPEELIVGKWAPAKHKEKGTVEFLKNGKVTLKGKDDDGKTFEATGTYKFVGAEAVEVVLTVAGESKKERLAVKVAKDELTVIDAKKRSETFQRVR